jgi:uncharacterized membrane protein YfcA
VSVPFELQVALLGVMLALWALLVALVVRQRRRAREQPREREQLPSSAMRLINAVAGVILGVIVAGGFIMFLLLGNEPVGH